MRDVVQPGFSRFSARTVVSRGFVKYDTKSPRNLPRTTSKFQVCLFDFVDDFSHHSCFTYQSRRYQISTVPT